MPRIASRSIALLAIAGALLVPTSDTLAQGAPAAPSSVPGTYAPSSQSVTLPARGSVMAQVEARFGVPEAKLPAVGEPPISRWVYQAFTVYFENRHVIHAVMHQ